LRPQGVGFGPQGEAATDPKRKGSYMTNRWGPRGVAGGCHDVNLFVKKRRGGISEINNKAREEKKSRTPYKEEKKKKKELLTKRHASTKENPGKPKNKKPGFRVKMGFLKAGQGNGYRSTPEREAFRRVKKKQEQTRKQTP